MGACTPRVRARAVAPVLATANVLVAMIAGKLLNAYCPPTGERHSSMMSVVIGVMTLVGPVGILALRRVIARPEEMKENLPERGRVRLLSAARG